MQFLEINEEQFDQFSKNYKDTNFWQSVNMAKLREWNGWHTKYVALKDENNILAATMLSYREVFLGATYVQAVRGYLIDIHDLKLFDFFHSELMNYLKTLKCMYFKIDPYVLHLERDINGEIVENGINNETFVEHLKALGFKHSGYLRGNDSLREPNWMFVLNLKDRKEDELLKSFDQQTRWSINKTLKMGIEVRKVNYDRIHEFKAIMEHTANRRGFMDHDLHYYEGLFKYFNESGNMLALEAVLDLDQYDTNLQNQRQHALAQLAQVEEALLSVANSKKYNKRKKVLLEDIALFDKKLQESQELRAVSDDGILVLAGATFILYGKEIMYLYSGAYEKYMRMNAPYALQWYIIRYGLAHGYERYNFYGISGIFEKDAEDYGVYEFKKGFTGTVEELIGDFYYIQKPVYYFVYELLRKLKHAIRK